VANPEQLQKGVEVWIKRPAHVYANVIGPRAGDAGLPPEKVNYKVRILPSIQYLPPEDLELVDPPKDPEGAARIPEQGVGRRTWEFARIGAALACESE
jgi:hypothetical protein